MAFDDPTKSTFLQIHTWIAEQGHRAEAAATLLGGASAGTAVAQLMREITAARSLSQRHHARLRSLCEILMLQELAHDGIPEPLPCHPDDPRVIEICLLADSLSDLLSGLERVACRAA